MRKLLLVVAGLGLLMSGAVGRAGEPTLQEKIDALNARVKALEAEDQEKDRLFQGGAQWADKIEIHGSLRYRYEWLDTEELDGEDRVDRNRQRIQAKIGLDVKINELVDAQFVLASDSGSPTSTNVTLDGNFGNKEFRIDIAAIDYHPEAIDGLHLLGGKLKNPFHRPAKNELVWDGDLRPEGLAAKYKTSFDNISLFASGGGFYVDEQSGGADNALIGFQGGLTYKDLNLFGVDFKVTGGLGYFDYTNVEGADTFGGDFGNTVRTSGGADVYVEDYDELEVFVEIDFKAYDLPVKIFGDYVNNTAVNQNDWGFLVGTTIGKTKDPGSWKFRYFYRRLEADAVIGAFTDSDFIDSGTDGKGHEVGFDYQVFEKCTASVTYFNNEMEMDTDAEKNFQRFQLDFKVKF